MDLLEQLAEATAELERLQDKWDGYMGNNPNKYRSVIKNAREKCNDLAMQNRGAYPLYRAGASH